MPPANTWGPVHSRGAEGPVEAHPGVVRRRAPRSSAREHRERGGFVAAAVVADLAHGAVVGSLVGVETYRKGKDVRSLEVHIYGGGGVAWRGVAWRGVAWHAVA